MAKKSIGLNYIKMGAIAVDGDMGTVLTQIPATVSDSASITTAEGTKTDFNIEESDDPFFSLTGAGAKTLAWECYDVDLDTLSRFWGGAVNAASGGVGRTWDMPESLPAIERSIEIGTRDGWTLKIARGSVFARLQWDLKKTALAKVVISVTVLKPTKVGVPGIKFIEPL